MSYQAIFYSGPKRINKSPVVQTIDEAEKEIEKANKLYEVFHYTPWTHTKIENV